MALEVAGVQFFAPEGGGDRFGWQGGEVSKVIDGCTEVLVTVAKGVRGVWEGVEAEGTLAHLQLDGADGEGWLAGVGDGDADGGGVMEIGGDDGGEGELRGVDGRGLVEDVGGAGDASDLAVDDFLRLIGLVGVGGGGDGDVAEEVGFIGGVEDKLDALDGQMCRDVELRDGGGALLGEGVRGGDDGVEGLGFAAGGDSGTLDEGGVEVGEGFAV